ncbi:hypothetical protein [Kurthia massiliensis]|nr:hypothetical protein [Kurthia massiliensis]
MKKPLYRASVAAIVLTAMTANMNMNAFAEEIEAPQVNEQQTTASL